MLDRSARADPVTPVRLTVDPGLDGVLSAAAVQAEGVAVREAEAPLRTEFERLADGLRERWSGCAPAEIDALAPARELYRAFGVDPTKTRPSSESLLRRVLKSKPLPRVNNAVDLCNLLSLRFLLPLGLYDVARIRGAVTIRRGRAGESYPGIRKAEVHLEGRPTLADDEGPFGNPTSDSARTCVTASTTGLLLVIFAPASFPTADLDRHATTTADSMRAHLGPAVSTTTTPLGIGV